MKYDIPGSKQKEQVIRRISSFPRIRLKKKLSNITNAFGLNSGKHYFREHENFHDPNAFDFSICLL